jgi:glycosyltransferase involved in cell wall biosynthesis
MQLVKWLYKSLHSEASLNKETRPLKLIVSLTTIPPRIGKINEVILRMLKQTVKPDKIIVYLGKDKFEGKTLPLFLRLQMEIFGVEVRYVEDIGPHTKYFHTITEFPDDIIITVDDDIRYPDDMIEELYNSYKKFPKAVSARRCHTITFNEDGKVKKYTDWLHKQKELIHTPSMKLFPTGVGGVLYPPKTLHPEVYNLDMIKKISLKNDDVWLKFMEVLNNTPVVATKPFVIKHVKGSQKVALNAENVAGQRNDTIIADVISAYDRFLAQEDSMLNKIKNSI